MMPTRLCLVRHGETAWNAERRIQGQLDIALNVNGFAQAEAVGSALAGESFAAIYSSDLCRARQTAAIAARRHNLYVRTNPGLRERHYGVFQGQTYQEAKVLYPADYERFSLRDPDFDFGNGESLLLFARRVHGCIGQLATQHQGKRILIVTHGGVLDIVYRFVTVMPLGAPRDFNLPNAGLNWVELDRAKWRLAHWANEDHLGAPLDELPG